MSNLSQAERTYHTEDTAQPKIVGTCENSKCQQILTDDYQVFKDCDNNLFCSEKCALEHYGVEEYADG